MLGPPDLFLFVVAIKDKAPPRIGGVRDQIAVLVKGVALPGCKAVRVRIDRRVGKIRLRDLRRTDEFVVAQPIAITVIGKPLLPRPRAVLRFLRIDEPVKRVVFVPCYEGLREAIKRKRLPGDVPGVRTCVNSAIRLKLTVFLLQLPQVARFRPMAKRKFRHLQTGIELRSLPKPIAKLQLFDPPVRHISAGNDLAAVVLYAGGSR